MMGKNRKTQEKAKMDVTSSKSGQKNGANARNRTEDLFITRYHVLRQYLVYNKCVILIFSPVLYFNLTLRKICAILREKKRKVEKESFPVR